MTVPYTSLFLLPCHCLYPFYFHGDPPSFLHRNERMEADVTLV
jgi:hypothetical protein